MKSKDERVPMRELAGSRGERRPSPARVCAASAGSGKLRGNWEVAGQRACPCGAGGGVVLSRSLLSPQTVWSWDFCRAGGKAVVTAWGRVCVLWSREHRAGPHKESRVGQRWVIQGPP